MCSYHLIKLFCSILVLKDGEIVESGNHKELLAKKGIFAEMWEKQITSDETHTSGPFDAAPAVKGYDVYHEAMATDATAVPAPQIIPDTAAEPSIFMPGPALVPLPPTEAELKAKADGASSVKAPSAAPVDSVTAAEFALESPVAETAELPKADSEVLPPAVPVEQPGTYSDIVVDEPKAEETSLASPPVSPGSVAFPSSTPAPVAFPTSDDSSSRRQSIAPTGTITFKDEVPPSVASGDKKDDKDKEPKRKRISSQNFQRLARRISMGARKSSSSSNVLPPGDSPSREASLDLGASSSGPGTPGPEQKERSSTPIMASVVAAAKAALSGNDSDSESTERKDKKMLKKRPTRSKTGW